MIHYHGAPISGSLEAQFAFSAKHVMVSYANKEHVSIVAEICQSFALDNGAYSAWRTGEKFDIEGYARCVELWHRHPAFDWYILPDVIDGGVDANRAILDEWFSLVDGDVRSKGVPVWHLDEPIDSLCWMADTYARVAFGSAGQYATIGDERWWQRMAEAMDAVTDDDGRPICKLHGLRMLDPDVFTHIPLSSADSTNVARHAGSDSRWKGAYVPTSKRVRALVMMDRIEHHASAKRWNGHHAFRNWELFG